MKSLRDSGIASPLNERSGEYGAFVTLHNVAWGRRDLKTIFHDHIVRRDSYQDPPQTVKVLRWANDDDMNNLYPHFNVSSILIRKDYVDLLLDILQYDLQKPLDELLAACLSQKAELSERLLDHFPRSGSAGHGAVIIIGNPGIGKSLFMYFVLALRVLAGVPTVFQLYKESVCIINHEGVFCVDYPIGNKSLADYVPDGTWILVDSDEVIGVPSQLRAFSARLKGLVLQTTTFRRDNRRWSWKMSHMPREFWMTPWTLEELIQARDLQFWTRKFRRPSEQQLGEFVTKYGRSPRYAYDYDGPGGRVDMAIRGEATMLISEIREALDKHDHLDFENGRYDYTISGAPDPSDRRRFMLSIASEHLTDHILEQLKVTHERATSRLYWLFRTNPYTRPCAGHLLKRLAFETFPQGGRWEATAMEKEVGDEDTHWRTRPGSSRLLLDLGAKGRILTINPMPKEGAFRPLSKTSRSEEEDQCIATGESYGPISRFQPSSESEIFAFDAAQSYAVLLSTSVSAAVSFPTASLDTLIALGARKIDLIMVTDPRDTMDVYVANSHRDRIRNVYHVILHGDAQ